MPFVRRGGVQTSPLNLLKKYTDCFEISKLKFTSEENAILRVSMQHYIVIPAKAGIQGVWEIIICLDTRFHGYDELL